MSADTTEEHRRSEQQRINSTPRTREELESGGSEVWDTTELLRDFTVQGFMAPFAFVTQKSDGMSGTVTFQHEPRLYFDFLPETQEQF